MGVNCCQRPVRCLWQGFLNAFFAGEYSPDLPAILKIVFSIEVPVNLPSQFNGQSQRIAGVGLFGSLLNFK